MGVVSSDELLGLFKCKEGTIVFRATVTGKAALTLFARLPLSSRVELVRQWVSRWDEGEGDPDVLVARGDLLPAALPSNALIGLSGGNSFWATDTPTLDDDGFPTDPAAAMGVFDRIASEV